MHGHRPVTSIVITACLALFVPRALAEEALTGRVHLVCKLKLPENAPRNKTWVISLVKVTGEFAGQATTSDGAGVRFTYLDSGIYRICIRDDTPCPRCKTLDLTLIPEDLKSVVEYVREMNVPPSRFKTKTNIVSVSELSVPKKAAKEMKKADVAWTRGDMQNFRQHLERVLGLFPSHARALNNLGIYWQRLGQYSLASQYFSSATEADPAYAMAFNNLAYSLILTDQSEAALDASSKALALCPDDLQANVLAAISYYNLQEYDQARKYFESVLALDPANPVNPQLRLYRIALIKKNEPEAVKYLRDFLQSHPNEKDAAHYRGVLDAMVSRMSVLQSEAK